MSNKNVRELKEMKNLFEDPKFARQAWKSLGQAILLQPAVKPVQTFDRNGEESYSSMIERYSYNRLADDIANTASEKREPTEIEMILHCQMIKARTDTSAAVFIRDTLGAKPVDESKVDATVNNPYENMTDEELEVLQKYREEQKVKELDNTSEALPDSTSTVLIVKEDYCIDGKEGVKVEY